MKCYVLNLDRSPERLEIFKESFSATSLEVTRVAAVDGRELSPTQPEFSTTRYRFFHGQRFDGSVFGCALSHLKALKTFLETDDSYAMICEDDVVATPDLERALDGAFRYKKSWNLLRVNYLRKKHRPVPYARLDETFSLCRFWGWYQGSGGYVCDRRAAETILAKAYPIFLPYDHFLARSHLWGLQTAVVDPEPIVLGTEAAQTTINYRGFRKYPRLIRWTTTLPYRGCVEARKNLRQFQEILATKMFPPRPE